MKKRYVVGQTGFHGARHSWRKPTQQQAIYETIKKAGNGGLTADEIVTALESTQFEKGVGCSAKNVAFYLNKMKKIGQIAEYGAAAAVTPTMKADDAAFAALAVLESALVAKMRETGVTDDARHGFLTYQKAKALAVSSPAPGSSPAQVEAQKNEARVGLRMALIAAVKLVY